jgi:hypothetical protein
MTTRKGYFVALIVLLAGVGVAGFFGWRIFQQVEGYQRFEVPGQRTVTLPAGEYIAFAEVTSASTVDLLAKCRAIDSAGIPAVFGAPSATTSYTFGSRKGASMFQLKVATTGVVNVDCTSDDQFTMAIGAGIGSGLVTALVAFFAGGILFFIIFLRTYLRRRREAKAVR